MLYLTALSCGGSNPTAPSPTSSAPAAVLMHVHDGNGRLALVNVGTGATQIIGDTGASLTDIAFDQGGRLFGISFTHLYSIDASTARASVVGAHQIPGANALEGATNGRLLVASGVTDGLYSLNAQTAQATWLGGTGFRSGGDLAFHRSVLYLASIEGLLVQIDPTLPSRSRSIGSLGVASVFGLASGSDVLYGSADVRMYVIDTTSGMAVRPVTFGASGLGVSYGQAYRP